MMFKLAEFEHKIDAKKLKKGLKLFKTNNIELISKKASSEFVFLINATISGEICVKIASEKILDYHCFCNNTNYCEHLAASIFIIQKDRLEFGPTTYKLIKKELTQQLKQKKKTTLLSNYIQEIKQIIEPYKNLQKLNNQHIIDICKKITLKKAVLNNQSPSFMHDLAIICELPKLVNLNYSLKDNLLVSIIKNSKNEVARIFKKGLGIDEKAALLDAANYSIKSQINFNAGVFPFLISRVCVIINNKNDFEKLLLQLKKRRLTKNKLDVINRKTIAELQLLIMEAKLTNKEFALKKFDSNIELGLALAELAFLQNKKSKGSKLLKYYGIKIKQNNLNKYLDFIDEVLGFAKEYIINKLELTFLLEKFICGFYIDSNELDRFFYLSQNPTEAANELIKKLNLESVFCTFDKKAVVFLNQGRIDELIVEIKTEKNKFKLLHKIATENLESYSIDFIILYCRHLLNAINTGKFPYFQEQLLLMAKTFFDCLDGNQLKHAMILLKEKLIYEKYALTYLEKLYPTKES